MARAEAARPSGAEYWSFARAFSAARPALSGHARLLARPAYQKLVAAEPFLRRLIPILIGIFLLVVGMARFAELYQQHIDREREARDMMSMIAATVARTLDSVSIDLHAPRARQHVLNALADALPA